MSKPWPEPWGKSLDIAVGDAWTFGAGVLWYWLAGRPTWWVVLVAVLVLGASTYGIRRWKARRNRARGTYSGEYRRGGMVLRVESNDLGVVEQTIRRMSDQAREAWQDAQHKDA